MKSIGVCNDDLFRLHDNGVGHPESPERNAAISRGVTAFRTGYPGEIYRLSPRPATPGEIMLIHSERHFDRVAMTANREWTALDHETAANSDSFDTALNAAGASIDAARALLEGRADTAFCAVRPPGHHAEHDRSMGFCIFNNVAVAAKWATTEAGLTRVAVVDWDVHHGNGTMHSLYSDPDTLFISIHQYPHYPGTGRIDEIGSGRGTGMTINVPAPPGWGDGEYRQVFDSVIVPVIEEYEPELLIMSAGFDAHVLDQISSIRLTTPMYAYMAHRLISAMPSKNRVLAILEGGYHMTALEVSVQAMLEGLVSENIPEIETPAEGADSVIEEIAAAHADFRRCLG